MVWHEVALTHLAHQFEQQITDLVPFPFLKENWKAGGRPKTVNPVSRAPLRARDLPRGLTSFLLDLPRSDHSPPALGTVANYDLSSPRSPIAPAPRRTFKAQTVIAPLARALGPRRPPDRIHSHGHDPATNRAAVLAGDNPSCMSLPPPHIIRR